MIKKLPADSNPKNIFSTNLFWDAEDIDIEQHAAYIISRVLDYGNERDLKILREIYPDEKLIEVGYETGFGEKGSMGFGMVKESV